MVANITRSSMSQVQTIKDIFFGIYLLKAFTQGTLCWNLATFCPLTAEICPKMWFSKVKVIGSKINYTIRFLNLKNMDLDTKIVILSALVQVMVKDVSLHNNGGQRNTFVYVASSNCSKYFLIY